MTAILRLSLLTSGQHLNNLARPMPYVKCKLRKWYCTGPHTPKLAHYTHNETVSISVNIQNNKVKWLLHIMDKKNAQSEGSQTTRPCPLRPLFVSFSQMFTLPVYVQFILRSLFRMTCRSDFFRNYLPANNNGTKNIDEIFPANGTPPLKHTNELRPIWRYLHSSHNYQKVW